jgi:hypothetical protein
MQLWTPAQQEELCQKLVSPTLHAVHAQVTEASCGSLRPVWSMQESCIKVVLMVHLDSHSAAELHLNYRLVPCMCAVPHSVAP